MSDDPIIRISAARSESAPSVAAKRPALGRGLGALLGDSRREEPLVTSSAPDTAGRTSGSSTPTTGLALLAVADIAPHPDQPRRHFDEAALDELAASIAARGVIQPVIVRPLAPGKWQLVAGERRWRAQLHEIPAIIRDLSEREVMALALIENLQREDLNPAEEARAYHRLAEDEGLTQAEIARMVDKSRSHVANLMRLLALPDAVIAMLEDGRLSMGHARALVGAEDALVLAQEAVAKGLSVREVEKLLRRRAAPTSAPRRARAERETAASADIAAIQNHLKKFLELSVRINTDADPRSGSVTIRYRSLDQLDLICQRLTGGGI